MEKRGVQEINRHPVAMSRSLVKLMGKHSIFEKPFGAIMRWLGGIPIERSASHNVVEASIEEFRKNENLSSSSKWHVSGVETLNDYPLRLTPVST